MRSLSVTAVFLLLSVQVWADWGLNSEFIFETCQTKSVAECQKFRGRSYKTNGSGATVIWKIGTKRIVSWGGATKEANDLIKNKMNFDYILYADFEACPMEKDIPGHRIKYCVESIKNPYWEKVK